MYKIDINLPISNHEVPELRELVGWGRRDKDFPALFERCNFWAGARDENDKLIAFGYITGMGLEHGYMEDIIVHPDYQKKGIGVNLVKDLLQEAKRFGLGIITVSYDPENENFYKTSGFTAGLGGVCYLD
ncbi:GNAT family N-acetyltransferase [Neobacillus sp. PS3-34]|uniref:GNAT family N-acetyltransferase n=1 Tax=Neobacillus sp. PS3-34 TaxID=3070678 RepID=UPI0027DF385B|nr:GNAT family N-acetyltransferase [Neobacillus sp. PS3-34]WML48387.1 GNAT family N-acetyltransferase [Neobacillus sp. PS3-34]